MCKIGYQSHPELVSKHYIFEIVDVDNNNKIFRDSSLFDSDTMSYLELNAPITLKKNKEYTIRRILQRPTGSVSHIIGRVIGSDRAEYPVETDFITFKNSYYYDFIPSKSAPGAIPFINMVFSN